MATNLGGQNEDPHRDQLGVREIPDFFLECETCLHFFERFALADAAGNRYRILSHSSRLFFLLLGLLPQFLEFVHGRLLRARPLARSRSSIH